MARSLSDYILVRTPLLALIEPDVGWVRTVLRSAREEVERDVGVWIEWSLTQGWQASEDLLHSSGLSRISGYQSSTEPLHYLGELYGWLKSSRPSQTEERSSPFAQGVAVIWDLDRFLDEPGLGRMMVDLEEMLSAHDATMILPLSRPLPDGHPASGVVVPFHPPADPTLRYGHHVRALVRLYGDDGDEDAETVAALCQLLDGLPVAVAETRLQLAVLDQMRSGEDAGLVEHVRRVCEEAHSSD